MNTTKTKKLSFYNDQGILTLTAKQFDTGRRFVFHIMDNDMPFDLSGCTAYLRIAKADGTQFQGHECCTVECSKIIINTAVGNGSQILTAAGINACELHLKDANDIALTTWTFHIVVEPRVHDGSHMSSIDSYDVLDNMINMEKERIANEKQRKENEENRKTVFEQKIGETNSVITECRLVIDTANQKINSFDEEINDIVDGITDEAQSYANNAKASETNAANAASSATDSANTASQKASNAAASAALSQSYAVGGTQSRAGEDADNAKYYSEKAQETLENLQKTVVTGVKGESESTYRTGNVNLTAENIGALPASDGWIGNDDESFAYNGFGFRGTGNQSIENFDTIRVTHVEALSELITDNIYTTNMEVNDVTGHYITLENDDYSMEFTPKYIRGGSFQELKNFHAVEAELIEGDVLYYDGEDTDMRYLQQTGGTISGNVTGPTFTATEQISLNGGIVSGLQTAGTAKMFGNGMAMSNPGTRNDQGWVRVTGTDENDTVLEIATGDDGGAGEEIVVRQYNTNNQVAREIKLFDKSGNATFPHKITMTNAQINGNVNITGNMRLKNSGNYGNKLNFGDGEYVYLYENEDDVLTIRSASGIKLAMNYLEDLILEAEDDDVIMSLKQYIQTHAGSGIYAYTYNHGLSSSNPVTYDCIQYTNGIMIYSIQALMTSRWGVSVRLPISFINNDASVVMSNDNSINSFNTFVDTYIHTNGWRASRTSYGLTGTGFLYRHGDVNQFYIYNAGSNGVYGEVAHHVSLMAMGRWK